MKENESFEAFWSEDHMVAREARIFWDEANMPVQRAKDLEVVYKAWKEGRINCWADVSDYMLPFDSDEFK